jgi:hypothetical protein
MIIGSLGLIGGPDAMRAFIMLMISPTLRLFEYATLGNSSPESEGVPSVI